MHLFRTGCFGENHENGGQYHKAIGMSYWYQKKGIHSLFQITFENKDADKGKQIISSLYEAFGSKIGSKLAIKNHQFFDQNGTPKTKQYINTKRKHNLQYEEHKVPMEYFLKSMNYDCVWDEMQKINDCLSSKKAIYSRMDGKIKLERGNDCHSYALTILEGFTSLRYPIDQNKMNPPLDIIPDIQ